MTQRRRMTRNLGLVAIAVCAGIGLFLGLMPGMDHQTRADSQASWTQTGLLGTARTNLATATLLPNGQVLLAGGQAGQDGSDQGISNATAVAELYDPITGAFSPTGPMAFARTSQTAILIDDGRVFFVGGVNESGTYQSTTEVYDPATGSFTPTGSMTTARAGHAAIQLPGGQVLIMGGRDGNDFLALAEVYDPATGVFSPTGSMQVARSNFSAVLLNTGEVLVFGGYGSLARAGKGKGSRGAESDGFPDFQALDSAELYDPVLGTFTPTGSLQTGRADFQQAVRLLSGDVLVVGGVGSDGKGLSSAEIYSTESGVFTSTGSMETVRQHHTLTVLPNGQILVAGGWTGIGEAVLASVEIYDPDTGQFSLTDSLVTGRGFHTATLLDNGTVLVAGGSGDASLSSPALASAEIFTCPSCLIPLDAPSQVEASDVPSDQGGAVHLTWTPSSSSEVSETRVYSSTTAGGPYSLVATLSDPATTTYDDTGLANGVLHYYVVRAFDGNQESDNSNEASAMSLDNVVPNSPSVMTVTDTLSDDGTSLSLSWIPSTSEDIVEQRVHRGLTSGGPYTLVATFPGNTTTTFVDTGLMPEMTYYYVLSAFDGTQESPFTAEAAGQPQDNRPVATALQLGLEEDASVSITLVGQDPEGGPVTYVITTSPTNGQLSGLPPQLTYVPVADFNGVDSFLYVVSTDSLTSEPATVVLTVSPLNDPPVAVADVWTVEEDVTAAVLDVLANDTTGPDGVEVLTITSVSSTSQGGSVNVASDNQNLLYTPPANFSGTDTFTYTITDGAPNSEATAVVTVTVTPVNDPPSIAQLMLSWTPSLSPNVVEQRVYRSPNFPGLYQLIRSIEDPTVTSFTDTNGLEVGKNYYYVVRAYDGTRESSNSNEVYVLVGHRFVLGEEDTSVSFKLAGYDLDSASLAYVIEQGPQNGIVTGEGPNLVYAPDSDFVGIDSLTYMVSDGALSSETGTVTFSISGVNDAPIANSQTLQVSLNSETSISLTGQDGDPEAEQVLSVILDTLPVVGDLSLSAGGVEIIPTQLPLVLNNPELFYRAPSEGADPVTFAFHVQDNGGTANGGVDTSSNATVTLNLAAGGVGFTAYNDLAWGTGQLTTNITTYTSPVGGSGLLSSGLFVDQATGDVTGVSLSVVGGDFIGDANASQGAEPSTGDALTFFSGIVSVQGAISYINQAGSSLVLTFTGLNPENTYDLVYTGHRDKYAWDRASLVTISGADAFTNESSVATDNPNTLPGGEIFSGPTDPSTRLPADNANGYVARFTGIDPGSDGEVLLTISWGGTAGSEYKGKYGSAVMLKEYMGP